jgi:hypothetical protein
VAALAGSPRLGRLRFLALEQCRKVGDKGAIALASATGLGALEDLDLSYTRVTEKGAAELARATGLPNLKMLNLSGVTVSNATYKRLTKRFEDVRVDVE